MLVIGIDAGAAIVAHAESFEVIGHSKVLIPNGKQGDAGLDALLPAIASTLLTAPHSKGKRAGTDPPRHAPERYQVAKVASPAPSDSPSRCARAVGRHPSGSPGLCQEFAARFFENGLHRRL
jgi:hypothetical protein